MRAAYYIVVGILAVISAGFAQEKTKSVVVRAYCQELSFKLQPPHPEFTVCDTHLTDEPEWTDPTDSPPPLSMARAAQISRGEIERYADGALEWRVVEIQLKEFIPKKWIYVVHWEVFDGGAYKIQRLEIPVLLSGQPVKGKDRRSSIAEAPAN